MNLQNISFMELHFVYNNYIFFVSAIFFLALNEFVCIIPFKHLNRVVGGLFVLNIPDQLIIGGMDIKLSPPSYKEKDDENAI